MLLTDACLTMYYSSMDNRCELSQYSTETDVMRSSAGLILRIQENIVYQVVLTFKTNVSEK